MDINDLFNQWYIFLSSLNSSIALPIRDLSNGLGIPLVSAFLFGLLATTAPCQLSTNFGALAFLTRQPADRGGTFRATLAYMAAKVLVYTALGLIVLTLGQGLINALLPYMEWVRKLVGPLMIVLGLAVLGVFRVRFQFGQGLARRMEREATSVDAQERVQARPLAQTSARLRLVPQQSLTPASASASAATSALTLAGSASAPSTPVSSDAVAVEAVPESSAPSPRASFLLGLGFSLAFCPTLFLLFFGVTMTLAARSAGGFAFPAIFALGATLPLLLLVGVTISGSNAARRVRRGLRRANRPLRWLGGAVLIFFGIHDTFIYWFL